jgi:hypothetical protein
MSESTFLIILGILLGALQLGIGAFLMSLLKRIDAVEKDNVSIKTNYLNKFTEVHKKLGETEVSIIREFNSGLSILADRFANAIDKLTNRIEKITDNREKQ